jgi:hypothetical protein
MGKYPAPFGKATIVCCHLCRNKSELPKENVNRLSWEINYCESFSTSKLTSHMKAHHRDVYVRENAKTNKGITDGEIEKFVSKKLCLKNRWNCV